MILQEILRIRHIANYHLIAMHQNLFLVHLLGREPHKHRKEQHTKQKKKPARARPIRNPNLLTTRAAAAWTGMPCSSASASASALIFTTSSIQ